MIPGALLGLAAMASMSDARFLGDLRRHCMTASPPKPNPAKQARRAKAQAGRRAAKKNRKA